MIKIPIEMPKNCHECDSFGILDLFGFECPATMEDGKYDFSIGLTDVLLRWMN